MESDWQDLRIDYQCVIGETRLSALAVCGMDNTTFVY
jgi:hypothetical protein